MSLVKKLGIGLTEKEKREREIAKKLKNLFATMLVVMK